MIDKNLLLISHIADQDGITPVVLAKLVYKSVYTILVNPGEVDQAYLENMDKYDEIHITDVNVSNELAEKINSDKKLKAKTKIFDHHISAIDLNKYDFETVIVEQNNIKESAASIYYKYLKTISDNPLLHKNSTKGLVEQVRIVDTYDFKDEEDKQALNLDYLFSLLGRDNYQKYFKKYIEENDSFEYTNKEKFLIKLEKDKVDNYIKNKAKEMFKAKIDGYTVGIVFAENYRSILGNYLLENNNIDFAIIINVSKSISYRSNGKVDLSVFSTKYNGGGHKNAAGSPLPENLLKNITKLIFKNTEFIKEEDTNE